MATQISELRVQGRADTNQLTAQLAAAQAAVKGVQKSVNELGNAAEQAGKKTEQAFSQRGLQRVMRELDPAAAAATARLKDHERQVKVLDGALARGMVSQAAYNRLALESGRVLAGPTAATQAYGKALGEVQGAAAAMTARLGPLGAVLGALGPIGIAAAAGVAAVGAVLVSGVRELEQYNRSLNRLQAVLTATGYAAGVTAKQVAGLANELEDTTMATEESVLDAAAALATFGSVAGDNFTRTLKAAQNMAAVLGGDLRGATLQLGKALSEPERGFELLRRSGVVATEAQRAMVKEMARTGDQAGALNKILEEVERRFGGAGASERRGVTGAFKGLTDAAGDFVKRLEEIIRLGQAASDIMFMFGRAIKMATPAPSDSAAGQDVLSERLSDAARRLQGNRSLPAGAGYRRDNALDYVTSLDDRLRSERAREQQATAAGGRAAAQAQTDQMKVRADAMDEILKQQEIELKFAGMIGVEKDKAVAAERARMDVIKAAGLKTKEEAAGMADVAAAAERAAGIAAGRVQTEARIALNIRAQAQGLEDAAAKAAQIDQDRRDAFQRGKDIATEDFGVVGNKEKQIRQLELEGEATRKAKLEYDQLTATYRVVNRDLEVLQETAEIKSSLKGSMVDPAHVDRLANSAVDLRMANERLVAQQQKVAEQLNRQNELMLEPFKNAAQGIQSAFADAFEGIFDGSVDVFDSIKRVAIRFASEMAALLVFRPILAGGLDALGFGGSLGALGLGGALGLPAMGAGAALGLGGVDPGYMPPGMSGGAGGLGSLFGLGGGSGFLGGGLQSIVGGAGLGFAAPQILRSLGLGIGKGSPVGGGIGAIGGALAGNFLLPGIGGFIGGALGGLLGDVVGGLFGGGGMSQEEYYQNVNYYNDQYQKTQARAAFNPTIAQYGARASATGGESQYKQALAQAEQDYQQLTAKMTELGYDASNFANVAQVYGQIVAKIGKEFRDRMNREVDLALGEITGNANASFAELLRTQQERRDQIIEVGADLVKAEQLFAAEKMAIFRELNDAQLDLLKGQLSAADKLLADMAKQAGDGAASLTAAANAFRAFSATVDEFTQALQLGSGSPLSAGAKLGILEGQFDSDYQKALMGDAEAIARVQQSGGALVQGLAGVYGAGDATQIGQQKVLDAMAVLKALAPGAATALDEQAIGYADLITRGGGALSDNKVTAAEFGALMPGIDALVDKLTGLVGPNNDAVKSLEGLAAKMTEMRLATEEAEAQLPSYGPGDVTPLPANDNSGLPGWQQGAMAGGPSTEFKDGLIRQLYPSATYDTAPYDARGAVDELFQGNPWSYMSMGGQQATDTLINTGLYSATQLEQRFQGTQYFGSAASQAAYISERIFGDQGGTGIGGNNAGASAGGFNDPNADGTMSYSEAEALGRALVNEALQDSLSKARISFNPFNLKDIADDLMGQIGPQLKSNLPADVVNMAKQLKDLVTQQVMNQPTPNIQQLSVLKNTIDKIVEDALGKIGAATGGDAGAGNAVGGTTTGGVVGNQGAIGGAVVGPGVTLGTLAPLSPAEIAAAEQAGKDAFGDPEGPGGTAEGGQGGGKALGGWVTGGIPGMDSVNTWLMPDEHVTRASQARKHRGLLDAINRDLPLTPFLPSMPVPVPANDGGQTAAEVRALREQMTYLLGAILTEEQKAAFNLRQIAQNTQGDGVVGDTAWKKAG